MCLNFQIIRLYHLVATGFNVRSMWMFLLYFFQDFIAPSIYYYFVSKNTLIIIFFVFVLFLFYDTGASISQRWTGLSGDTRLETDRSSSCSSMGRSPHTICCRCMNYHIHITKWRFLLKKYTVTTHLITLIVTRTIKVKISAMVVQMVTRVELLLDGSTKIFCCYKNI